LNVFWIIWSTSSSTSGPFEIAKALLPPALLFPDLMAEEDVLLNFPELLIFLDFAPYGSGSNFEPLLFEDLVEVIGLGVGMGDSMGSRVGDSVGDAECVGDSVGNHGGLSVGPKEQRMPVC
jgi:hypothetical protein